MRPIYISRRSAMPPEEDRQFLEETSPGEDLELPIDLAKQGDHLVIWAPMVGAKQEDISITVNNDILYIHKTNYSVEETGNFYVRECHFGPIAREIQLPMAVDPTNAQASLVDGVLKIILPILGNHQTRIIKIR